MVCDSAPFCYAPSMQRDVYVTSLYTDIVVQSGTAALSRHCVAFGCRPAVVPQTRLTPAFLLAMIPQSALTPIKQIIYRK